MRWIFAATVLAALAGFSACAAGTDTAGLTGGTGGTGGTSGTGGTTTSSSATVSSSSSSSSGSGGAGGMGGTGGATSSSSSGSGGAGGVGGADLCGNGTKDPGEQCDGSDFGALTCELLGLGTGQLQCNTFCAIVATGCLPKESCNNGEDDNQNGLIDCQDPDCVGASACMDTCTPPATADVPGFVFGDTTGRPAVHKASCSVASGQEVIYAVTPPQDGTMTLDLSSFSADLSLSVRTACGDDTSEIACSNTHPQFGDDEEKLSLQVTAGTTYYVMVDGNTAADMGQFDLSLDLPPPEDFCSDLFDDDNDGYLDCDDATNCQSSPECTPGTTPVGQPCFLPSDCTANHNDPICLDGSLGFPGGYCSEFCDQTADDCGPNAVCYAGLNISVHGVCLQACQVDGDCSPGFACVDKGLSKRVCALGPETNCTNQMDDDGDGLIDCQDPDTCQSSPDCVPGSKATGQPCAANTECFADANDPICLAFSGGYCSQFCSMSPDDCGNGSICTNEGPSGTPVCMRTCTVDAQCRAGYHCQDQGYASKICY